MNKMSTLDLINSPVNKDLKSLQIENLRAIIEISQKFHREAGIREVKAKPCEKSAVIETGHQPNFLPHSGTFKKAFLASRLTDLDPYSIALYGFADNNISTADLLSQNYLPSISKLGKLAIGFKVPSKKKFNIFSSIEKPSIESYREEIEKIKKHYAQTIKIEEILYDAYSRANNYADLNAFIFAKICSELLDTPVMFFRHSDIQKHEIFLDTTKKIILNLEEYNYTYNTTIQKRNLKIKDVPKNLVPFWYHCECNNKTRLILENDTLISKCLACQTEHTFPLEKLKDEYPNLSSNAVSRNVIFSEGVGNKLFVSGSGGSLDYGIISNEVSQKFEFNSPITIAWRSKDFYIGVVHQKIIQQMKKAFKTESITKLNDIDALLEEQEKTFIRDKEGSNPEDIQQNKDDAILRNLRNRVEITRNIFNLSPSFLDQIISLDINDIKNNWIKTLETAKVSQKGIAQIIEGDIDFNDSKMFIMENV